MKNYRKAVKGSTKICFWCFWCDTGEMKCHRKEFTKGLYDVHIDGTCDYFDKDD